MMFTCCVILLCSVLCQAQETPGDPAQYLDLGNQHLQKEQYADALVQLSQGGARIVTALPAMPKSC